EEDRERDLLLRDPARHGRTVLFDVDREHGEPAGAVLAVDLLDRRGQLPRAVRSGRVPEVDENRPAAEVSERHRLAVEGFERERRRRRAVEWDELEVPQETLEPVLRPAGAACRRTPGEEEQREGQGDEAIHSAAILPRFERALRSSASFAPAPALPAQSNPGGPFDDL